MTATLILISVVFFAAACLLWVAVRDSKPDASFTPDHEPWSW